MAIKVKTCLECKTLRVNLGSSSTELSVQSETSKFEWFYFTTYLEKGEAELALYSDGRTSIERVIIYSDSYSGEKIDDLFTGGNQPATLRSFTMISPTKYVARLDATSPFMLTFDREYDRLWAARVDDREYRPVMMYNGMNGFYVNETGELDIVIEYKPHSWFLFGSFITCITAIFSVGYLVYQSWKRVPSMQLKKIPKLVRMEPALTEMTTSHRYPIFSTNNYQKMISIRKIVVAGKVIISWDSRFLEPNSLILAALIIMICMPLLIIGNFTFVNQLMTFMYLLLIVGLSWKFTASLQKSSLNSKLTKIRQ
jgi:hypothetical protein